MTNLSVVFLVTSRATNVITSSALDLYEGKKRNLIITKENVMVNNGEEKKNPNKKGYEKQDCAMKRIFFCSFFFKKNIRFLKRISKIFLLSTKNNQSIT